MRNCEKCIACCNKTLLACILYKRTQILLPFYSTNIKFIKI